MSHGYTPSATYHGGAVTVPDDGDSRNASSVVTPIEAALDNAAWSHNVLANNYTLIYESGFSTDDAGHNLSTSALTSWFTWTDIGPNYANVFDLSLGAPTLAVGDIIEAEVNGTALCVVAGATPGYNFMQLASLPAGAGAYATMGGRWVAQPQAGTGSFNLPMFTSARQVVAGGQAGIWHVKLNAYIGPIGSTGNVQLVGPYCARIRVFRANGS